MPPSKDDYNPSNIASRSANFTPLDPSTSTEKEDPKLEEVDLSTSHDPHKYDNKKNHKKSSSDSSSKQNSKEKAPKFVSYVISFYRRWGYFIVDYDWLAILICILISSLAMIKLKLTKLVCNCFQKF